MKNVTELETSQNKISIGLLQPPLDKNLEDLAILILNLMTSSSDL